MKLEGKITIGRATCKSEHHIRIELTDESSGIRFATAEMSVENFGAAVTGLSYQPCTIELRGLQNIGKIREVKREHIEAERSFSLTKEQAKAIVEPYEIDGWKAHLDDVTNSRRWDKGRVTVTFVRWVDAEEEAEVGAIES